MELKQLRSFAAVVEQQSFTKAAEKTYTSQPTISAHIRALEEELHTRLILRDTKNLTVTPKGRELYACAIHMLELESNLLRRWADETKRLIHLGASTIPSAYILPEVLSQYAKLHPDTYFTVHQSDSAGVINGMQNGLFDIGLIGMEYEDELLRSEAFYQDRMVLITPVNERFLAMQTAQQQPLSILLNEPLILREKGSGSQKSADRYLERHAIREETITVAARVNDQEAIKNLVAGGLGVSIVSEKAVQNFVEEKRLLQFALPDSDANRSLYLLMLKEPASPLPDSPALQQFVAFVRAYYRM